jgi:hypothetical protein
VTRLRIATLLSLLVIIPTGFAAKLARPWSPPDSWMRDHGAGALYEVFWVLAAFLVWPTERASRRIPWFIFIVTCVLEFLQLWHPPLLEAIRATFIGRTLIGTTFDWWDFPPYAIGSFLGWVWIRLTLRLLRGTILRGT